MFSKLLVKLIDQSIVPAILLIGVRVVSIVFVSKYFGIDWNTQYGGFNYSNTADLRVVNSYSIFLMVTALAIGILYVLLKSWVFHESHISPHMTAHLFSLKLSSFIQTSYDIYSQGSIWLSYLFLLTISSLVMGFFGIIYMWVFWVAFVLSILTTITLILDIENELELKSAKKEETEDVVLNFGEIND